MIQTFGPIRLINQLHTPNGFGSFAGASPNTTYTNNWWNGTYDGVGSCNEAIALAGYAPYKTEAERNAKVAEAVSCVQSII